MIVHFSKYHGTGNDFIMIDGRSQDIALFDSGLIKHLCNRRLGIGSDGLIILEEADNSDFRMRYFNADGNEGTMCGNGGRCITLFASRLGVIGKETVFEGIDGLHTSSILPDGAIRLKLNDVEGIRQIDEGYLVDTGSPHFVVFVPEVESINVAEQGSHIRHQSRFGEQGTNVNFVAPDGAPDRIRVRTFERGVEDETLSCGTGVAAAAICSWFHDNTDVLTYAVETRGGSLKVSFQPESSGIITNVTLTGQATHVYDGTVRIGL